MNEIERKYDLIATKLFDKRLRKAFLNEYEKKILDATLECFCTSVNKTNYNPLQLKNGMIFYEFEVSIFHRRFRIVFEVDGIDASALDFEEI